VASAIFAGTMSSHPAVSVWHTDFHGPDTCNKAHLDWILTCICHFARTQANGSLATETDLLACTSHIADFLTVISFTASSTTHRWYHQTAFKMSVSNVHYNNISKHIYGYGYFLHSMNKRTVDLHQNENQCYIDANSEAFSFYLIIIKINSRSPPSLLWNG
jgi:hypothetical protein